jgi:hypothetical protein
MDARSEQENGGLYFKKSVRDHSPLFATFGIAAVGLTRIFFRSHILYDLDSVNFALGMARFDPAAHQPHPPGYFLYVCLARLVTLFLPEPNTALVAISIAASCGAAWMIYLLTREWFDARAARMSLVLFLFSPLCWFHGIVALTYIVEAFFSGLIGYLCWRVYAGKTGFAIPAAIAFGLAAGFRPSTALFLGPLWLFSLCRVRGARRWLAVLTAGAVMLLWFVPMVEAAGGVRQYWGALGHLWSTVPGRRTVFASPWLAVARIVTICWIFVLCFGSASALVFRPSPDGPFRPADRARFLGFWIVPGLLFFAFIFLSYTNSGYLLVLSPPVFAILAARLYGFATSRRNRWWPRMAIAAGIAANCALFGFAPLYCSYPSVRDFERTLTAITQDFRAHLNPKTTLIVGFDSHFLGYRHAGYYLPEFATVQYPEVGYSDGKRVFMMHGRDTQVVRTFSGDGFERFVFFPLPEGGEYAAYVNEVRAKLPKDSIATMTVGRWKVLTGQAWVLPLLFPSTAKGATDEPLQGGRN